MALTVEATKLKFALGALVEVASKHHRTEFEAPVKLRSSNANAHGPPLGALVVNVDIGNREAGARQVRGSAELASNNHALDGPRGVPEHAGDWKRRPRVVALKGVLVEEYRVVVLRDHVEVLCQRLVGDKTCPFLHADHGPLR